VLDQLANSGARPQREFHFQLLGPLLDDKFSNMSLLLSRKLPAFTAFLTSFFGLDGSKTAGLVKVDGGPHRWPAQAG
jgi:hypothetical protein